MIHSIHLAFVWVGWLLSMNLWSSQCVDLTPKLYLRKIVGHPWTEEKIIKLFDHSWLIYVIFSHPEFMIHHNKQRKPSKQALIVQYLLLFTVAGLPNCTFIEYYKFLNHLYNLAALSEMTLPPYQYVYAFWRAALFLTMTNNKASSTWLPDQEILRKLRLINRQGKCYRLNDFSHAMNNTGLITWQGGISKHASAPQNRMAQSGVGLSR